MNDHPEGLNLIYADDPLTRWGQILNLSPDGANHITARYALQSFRKKMPRLILLNGALGVLISFYPDGVLRTT
jgi:hypothetical protein